MLYALFMLKGNKTNKNSTGAYMKSIDLVFKTKQLEIKIWDDSAFKVNPMYSTATVDTCLCHA
jgi:hypothetical protein